MSVPVAFYAPLKSPDHPKPSGDRTVARLFRQALVLAGCEPTLASTLRTREPRGDAARQREIRAASLAEAELLLAAFLALAPERRPRLWFTYHSYYKAPDWLGPRVAAALGIPYVLAEASRAGKRAGGPFDLAHGGAEAALAAASLVLVATGNDREALMRPPRPSRLLDLPPFIEATAWRPDRERPPRLPGAPASLLVVAMMREGDKLASYAVLAQALARLSPEGHVRGDSLPPHPQGMAGNTQHPHPEVPSEARPRRTQDGHACFDGRLWPAPRHEEGGSDLDEARSVGSGAEPAWRLAVVGDGPARAEVERLFAPLAGRVAFLGRIDEPARLAALYRAADLFVWPAVNEAYGMVLLEAQSCGCPVLAGRHGGVASAMREGETGLLAEPGAVPFAEALAALLARPDRLARMREAAARFVAQTRTVEQAARIIGAALAPLLSRERAA